MDADATKGEVRIAKGGSVMGRRNWEVGLRFARIATFALSVSRGQQVTPQGCINKWWFENVLRDHFSR